jgi:putative oxidoreductase
MSFDKKLGYSLLSLRLGVFIVMLMWTLDKFINPDHAAKVFEKFYMIPDAGETMLYIVAGLQLVLVLAFGTGLFKRISYGAILLMHTVSTLSSYMKYMDPWNSLLFFAAFPMLAACFTLYLLRDRDTLLTLRKK